MKNFLILAIGCCMALCSLQAQNDACANNIFINGNAESGTPTGTDQDIGLATGFSRIWLPGSWADFYIGTTGPAGFSLPSPNTGNYVGCWIANQVSGGTIFREGFKTEFGFTIAANTGIHTLTFDVACMFGWGTSEIAVYALHNPGGLDAPYPPISAYNPTNINLFDVGNTNLIGILPLSTANCTNVKTTHSISINSNSTNFPAGGMTHIFITHSDNSSLNGAFYMGFDNFCLPINCPGNLAINGNLENGLASTADQDISAAVGFDGIWNGVGLSYADYYPATFAPAGFPTPIPASGNYAASWIANWKNGGTVYREGFQSQLASPIFANTGAYTLTFDMACLNGWGTAEVAVYGISNAAGGYGANPVAAYDPTNIDLFGAANTILMGTISVNATTCNTNKTTQAITFSSNTLAFPSAGVTHFFVTHSDNERIDGAYFMAFDDFCLQEATINPPTLCPELLSSAAECGQAGSYDYTITTSSVAGSVFLSSGCGTFSPSFLNLTGATSYTVLFTPNGSCGSTIIVDYTLGDVDGTDCLRQELETQLPKCLGCQCDEEFFEAVEQGFSYSEECPNDYVRPFALQDNCDRVDWTLDGVYIGFSMGNNYFTFPHLTNWTEVCMTVTRTTANGDVCEYRSCLEVEPEYNCDNGARFSGARLQVVPNPATSLVTLTWDSYRLPKNISATVYNSSGVSVQSIENMNSYDGYLRLNIQDLPTGLYYIQLRGAGYAPTPVKFIKK